MRVFLVDDSLIIRQRLAKILSVLSAVQIVGEAPDAGEAIRGIANLRPDVVILDLQLLSGTGVDVLTAIKQEQVTPPVVIMLTNYPYPVYRKLCLEAGADYFFDKSSEFPNILRVFKQLIQDSRDGLQVRGGDNLSGSQARTCS